MSDGLSDLRGRVGGRLPVPIIPTPRTPPRFGVADMTAVTVGRRSLLIPACGMITLVMVPCGDNAQLSVIIHQWDIKMESLRSQIQIHRLCYTQQVFQWNCAGPKLTSIPEERKSV